MNSFNVKPKYCFLSGTLLPNIEIPLNTWTRVVCIKLYRVIDLSGSSPEGVVVDAMAKLLFYTDNGRNTINVARTDNSRDRRVLITYAKHPRTIQIDPMRRSTLAY